MSLKKWTENQKLAIESRHGSILISAAAGSGKTAVLVERVIKTLTDKSNPCDADKLLIVTFTNAAAAEMRERISLKINELILKNPDDENLKRQKILLANAHICTIDSFCSELVRENFYKLNISSDFKIADSNEMTLLRNDTISRILESLYEENNPEFINLVETFGSVKDDSNLLKIVNLLYDFIRSHPFPEVWLDEKLDMYNVKSSIKENIFGKIIINYSNSAICYCISIVKNLISEISYEEDFFKAYNQGFNTDLIELLEIQEYLETKSWDEIAFKIKNFKLKTLKRLLGYKEDPLKLKIDENRAEIKSIFNKLKKLFVFSSEDALSDNKKIFPIVKELFSLVKTFSEEIDKIKRDRNICDFSDLEHLALKLLVRPQENNFLKTPEAIEISKKFQYIMVDEYQDTNEAQDMIFRAVSNNEENLFTVGDVKQSIYRFRQAMPEIFLRRKNSYDFYDKNLDNYPGKIILDKNFRSRFEILDFINFIFHQIMSKELGDMDYTKEEELHLGAQFNESNDNKISIQIINSTESFEDDMDILEARRISEMIYEMIGNHYKVTENGVERDVTYNDFCILLRSTNKHANIFLNELTKNGIPATSEVSNSFFKTIEISTIISLLNVINNPLDDIAFISVISSPIFGMSFEEINAIRAIDKKIPFYLAAKKYAELENTKCLSILNKIEEYRTLSVTLSCEDLINYIYEDSGYTYMVQAMPSGSLRLNNLRLLFEYARNYEATSQKGLSGFINFINKLKENNEDLAATSPPFGIENAVRIMSIHKSKGLEFPICFLANCSRLFKKDKDDILLHKDLGIGLNLIDKTYDYRYSSFQREAVKIALYNGSLSEELRILYVALTRAKEKLIILTTLKNPQKTLLKLNSQITNEKTLMPYAIKTRNSFSDWILMCALRHKSGKKLRDLIEEDSSKIIKNDTLLDIDLISLEYENVIKKDNLETSQDKTLVDEKFLSEIKQRFNFVYPFKELSIIPNKVTVTDIVSENRKKNFDFEKRPSFLLKEGITPAQKGIALHTFMQFIDFKKVKLNLHNEIERLIENGYLNPLEAKSLDRKKITNFLNSNLFERISKSDKVLREYQFTVNLNLDEYDNNLKDKTDEKIILQGSIDCAFMEDNEFVIVDYKTDKIKSIKETVEHYKKQLYLYNAAFTKCTGIKIKQNVLYLFYTNKAIFL